MPQNIFFVSGLPRSGSTLFQQIISQNPNFYSTPTSGLINFMMDAKRGWKENNEFRAEGMEKVQPRVNGAFKGMLEGYFHDELSKGKVVFDKSRGWLAYIEYLKEIFQNPDIKIICMVRDVRAILASFEKLYRKRDLSYLEYSSDDFIESQTVEGRADILLRKNGVLGLPITRVQDALRRQPKNIVVVTYKNMLMDPQGTFKGLHDILELRSYQYDFGNLKQITQEHDVYHGYKDLHDIKEGKLSLPESIPWEGMYEDQYIKTIGDRYSFLNGIANG